MQKDIKYLSTWLKEKSFDHQPPKQCKCFSSNWAKEGPPTESDPDAWNLICDKDQSCYSIKWPETKDLPYKNFETICKHTCGLNVSKNVPGGGNCYFFALSKIFQDKTYLKQLNEIREKFNIPAIPPLDAEQLRHLLAHFSLLANPLSI